MSTTQSFTKRVLAVLFAAVLACGLIALSGCSKSPEEEAKNALNAELHTFQEGELPSDFSAGDVTSGLSTEKLQELVTAWTGDFSYELGDATMDGDDKCIVAAKINSKQLSTALSNGMGDLVTYAMANQSATQEEITNEVVNIMVKQFNQMAPVESDVKVAMELVNNSWEVSDAGMNELATAIIGDTSELQSAISSAA